MTAAEHVAADCAAREAEGRARFRPNGGPYVTTHPRGLVGEAYEEVLDVLNYLHQIRPANAPVQDIRWDLGNMACRLAAQVYAGEAANG